MEVIRPIYVEHEALPQQYWVFVCGEERKDIEYLANPINADTPDFCNKAKGLLDVATLKRYQVAEVSVHTGLEGEIQQLSQPQLS
jgi:hypothetical protein